MDIRLYKILSKLDSWKGIDDAILQDGSILIYRLPVAPLSYLHQFFSPLSLENIEKIETLLKISLPEEYREFLLTFNGMEIYNQKLKIFGLKIKKNDGRYNSLFQPNDIIIENLGKCGRENYIQIASYEENYDVFIKNNGSEKIYLMIKDTVEIVHEYPSFYDWLDEAINQLQQAYPFIDRQKSSIKANILASFQKTFKIL